METSGFPVFPRSKGQGPLLPHLRWFDPPRRERQEGGWGPGMHYVTASVSFQRGPVPLGAAARGPQPRCRGACGGQGAGAGAVSGVLPLAVQRGGRGGRGAPRAEGGGGGVQAVAAHARGGRQAALCGGEGLGCAESRERDGDQRAVPGSGSLAPAWANHPQQQGGGVSTGMRRSGPLGTIPNRSPRGRDAGLPNKAHSARHGRCVLGEK